MKFIGIAGDAGAGKSTLVDSMIEPLMKMLVVSPSTLWKYDLVRLKFADPLYGMLSFIVGEPVEWLVNNKKTVDPIMNKSIRELMEHIGMGIRDRMPDFWIASMQKQLTNFRPSSRCGETLILIDDVRFENEAKFLLTKGATLIYLEGENTGLESGSELHLVKPLCHHVLKKEEQPLWNRWAEEFIDSNF